MGAWRDFAKMAMAMGGKKGRPPVLSSQAFYPYAAERQLSESLRAALLESWRKELSETVAGISDAAEDGTDAGFAESVDEMARKAADSVSLAAQQAFAKFSEMTIGHPYWPQGAEESAKKEWTETFAKLCKSADAQGKADIARAVYEGRNAGKNIRQVESEIEGSLKVKARNRAELIARTETGKLNNAATMAGYRSAGISYYRWLSTPDERTRPSHAALNGLICAVGEGDSYYEETEGGMVRHSRTADMYHGDPGTDFQCRCTCVPWDPEIDGKYEVKKVPEPEPKEPSKLEQEREKTRTAEKLAAKASEEAKSAKSELDSAKRALRLQKIAERRHSRSQTKVGKIQERWNIRQVKRAGIIKTEFAAKDTKPVKDVSDIQGIIDRYIKKFPGETEYSSINVKIFSKTPTLGGYVAMFASRQDEIIAFNTASPSIISPRPSAYKTLLSAFQKMQRGKELPFREEYALESFYHEILHSKAKKWIGLKQHGKGDYKRTAMETINQFVSRHDYADFIRRMGGKVYNQEMVLDEGGGYYRWVKTFRGFIKAKGLDELKVLSAFRDRLLNGNYDELDSALYDFFKAHSGTKKTLDEVLGTFETIEDSKKFVEFLSSSSP